MHASPKYDEKQRGDGRSVASRSMILSMECEEVVSGVQFLHNLTSYVSIQDQDFWEFPCYIPHVFVYNCIIERALNETALSRYT